MRDHQRLLPEPDSLDQFAEAGVPVQRQVAGLDQEIDQARGACLESSFQRKERAIGITDCRETHSEGFRPHVLMPGAQKE